VQAKTDVIDSQKTSFASEFDDFDDFLKENDGLQSLDGDDGGFIMFDEDEHVYVPGQDQDQPAPDQQSQGGLKIKGRESEDEGAEGVQVEGGGDNDDVSDNLSEDEDVELAAVMLMLAAACVESVIVDGVDAAVLTLSRASTATMLPPQTHIQAQCSLDGMDAENNGDEDVGHLMTNEAGEESEALSSTDDDHDKNYEIIVVNGVAHRRRLVSFRKDTQQRLEAKVKEYKLINDSKAEMFIKKEVRV
jgi:hypothetical protein